MRVVIASTFTAEPAATPLRFWLETLGLPADIMFAPYNQIFQQLLDPTSAMRQNRDGLNVLLVRWEDWASPPTDPESVARELAEALQEATTAITTPYLVITCPTSPALLADADRRAEQEAREHTFRVSLPHRPGLSLLTAADLERLYPAPAVHTAPGEGAASVPYTPLWYTAVSAVIVRRLAAGRRPPYKVLVVDCDGTLWDGVCGEDGPLGVAMTPAHQAWQQFLTTQQAAGLLLCLCSKNNLADVEAVFAARPEMPLTWGHLTAWQVNWQPKSDNLRALAAELQLGLDSFIFFDDSPLECAEVRANCPEVLTLQLPFQTETWPAFLQHLWALDARPLTEEDRQRTLYYQHQAARQRFEAHTPDIAAFVAGLQLAVTIQPLTPADVPRVAQLTQRTNQFNLTTIRRTEGEVLAAQTAVLEGWVVRVQDRFGDYGLVGVIFLHTTADTLSVDSFLLSCRALGRGVEHQMLAHLGRLAQGRGAAYIELVYRPTAKNVPARAWLTEVSAQCRPQETLTPDGTWHLLLTAPAAAAITFSPSSTPTTTPHPAPEPDVVAAAPLPPAPSALMQQLATEWRDITTVQAALERWRRRPRPELPQPYHPPATPLENWLAQVWAETLGLEQVGREDNFFALGGDSLQGVLALNQIQARLDSYLYLTALFDAPTVAELATYLRQRYPAAARWDEPAGVSQATEQRSPAGDQERWACLRQRLPHIAPRTAPPAELNPSAIFILSPPRSGSTLLRAMLAGHPDLFAPPELDLLGFNSLGERRAHLTGAESFRLNGPLRAIMHLHACDMETARQLMASYEEQDLPTPAFYSLLQQWAAPRLLVDKSVYYALDKETLRRAETDFTGARYIHLTRDPLGVVHSFAALRMDQLFYRHLAGFTPYELGEYTWLTAHHNILAFLETIPAERQLKVLFHDLVTQPAATLTTVCRFLGVKMHPAVLTPYADPDARMLDDGQGGRLRGDPRFHTHQAIDPTVVTNWREQIAVDFLSEETWALAQQLGHPRPTDVPRRPLSPEITAGSNGRPTLPSPPHLEQSEHGVLPALTAPPLASDSPAPLSLAQQRLWLLHQLEPDNPAYNERLALRLTGAFDPARLTAAVQQIAHRHAILRTTFHLLDGRPYQQIHPTPQVSLRYVDLRADPSPEETWQAAAPGEVRQLFDLAADPPWRLTLFQLADETHILLLVMHHIICDRWSLGLFLEELLALYTAGVKAALPPLPLQYADYARWQRQALSETWLAPQAAYWQTHLADAPPLLTLPTDRPRPPIQHYRGALIGAIIPPALTAHLQALSRAAGVTPFITTLAALAVLLHRYTGQTDLVLGTPVAGRHRPEIERLMGFFVNTLPLRLNVQGNPTFNQLLQHVRAVTAAAYAHQELPFERLVELLQPARSLSYTPIFQILFAWQNTPLPALNTPTLSLTPVEVDSGTAKFDLSFYVWEVGDALRLRVEYNSDLFTTDAIQRCLDRWLILLESVTNAPDQPLSQQAWLAPAEYNRLAHLGRPAPTPYPRDASLVDLWREQVRRTPQHPAVIMDDQVFSYATLNAQANQVANFLRRLGVGAGARVGVCLTRRVELVVALLGVLKTGAAYVPLDPTYPPARLHFMAQDAQLAVLLSQTTLAGLWSAAPMPMIALDDTSAAWRQASTDEPSITITPDQPAYIIYTSGSTGTPKGVVGLHRGAVNRCSWMWQTYPFTTNEVGCHKTALSFVDAVWEIFGPLLAGTPLVLIPEAVVQEPAQLVAALAQHQVTRLVLVPSLLHALLEHAPDLGQQLPQLRYWVSSGEALSPETVARFQAAAPAAHLLNLYGSSEVAADATYAEVTGALTPTDLVSIGRPIANMQAYVLDAYYQPLPESVPGELYIGGDGLAQGYWGRPDWTAERFIPHPLSDEPGTRLYRTGDIARWRADGTLDYLGRRDHQVKVRGFRIELGEIEQGLAAHPAVAHSVATLYPGPAGPQLVAYVALHPNQMVTADDLRRFLRDRLPAYMLPGAVITLPALPLTPNGKVDRRALPPPGEQVTTSPPAPHDELERQLSRLWAEGLGVAEVGVEDDFFALGGHSLLAVQLFDRIETRLGYRLPLATLFQASTVAGLARVIRGEGWKPEWSALVPIQPIGRRPPLFCVHPAGGHVLIFVDLARHLGPEQPVYGFKPLGLEEDEAPHGRVESMAAHYIHEMRTVQPHGPYHLGGRCFGALVVYEMAQQLRAAGEEVHLVALFEPVPLLPHGWRSSVRYYLNRLWDHLQRGLVMRSLRRRLRLTPVGSALSAPHERRRRQVARAHFAARKAYRPRPYPGKVLVFTSSEHPPTQRRRWLSRRAEIYPWEEMALGGCEQRLVAGSSHRNILQEPFVQQVASDLTAALKATSATHPAATSEQRHA